MNGLEVDTDGIDGSLDALRSASAAIEADLARLTASSARLESQWSGEAQMAYAVAHAAWQRHLAAMNAILAKTIDALKLSRDEYLETEQRVAERWSIG